MMRTICCGALELTLEGRTGTWLGLTWRGRHVLIGAPLDGVEIEALPPAEGAARLLDIEAQPLSGESTRVSILREHPVSGGGMIRSEEQIDLMPDAGRVERSLFLWLAQPGAEQRLLSAGNRAASAAEGATAQPGGEQRLLSASLLLPGFVAGSPDETTVTVPMARFVPCALSEAARRPRRFETERVGDNWDFLVTAPDIFPGAVTVENETAPLHVTALPMPNHCPVHLSLFGCDGRLTVGHQFGCEARLQAEDRLYVGSQTILFHEGGWRQALPAVGEYLAEAGLAPPEERPAWCEVASILEADLEHWGGTAGLLARLGEIQDAGFDTLYLMPWHAGGYGTLDYRRIDPKYGTEADLRRLCDAAHARSMHVLFDLLVNIAGPLSDYLTQHPDWFYRDESGRPMPHPSWGGACFDPAAPGFRKYMVDYAAYCCSELGADGFRVDAVSYRGGLWNSPIGLQPHEHSHAVFTLVGEIRDAVRRVNPEAILMAECFGPLQLPVSDLVCMNWISYLDWANDAALQESLTGTQRQRLLGEHLLIMPPRARLTGYTQTHDTLAFMGRDLQGPGVDAYFATQALMASGAMVFGGGWRMRARPEEAEAVWMRSLFAIRKRMGGVETGETSFPESRDEALFVAERPSLLGRVRVVTNFTRAPRPCPAGECIWTRLGSADGVLAAWDTVVLAFQVTPGLS